MENGSVSNAKRREGVYISTAQGFVILLLSVCLSVLVGLIVHLTSPGQDICQCGPAKQEISVITPEQLTARCAGLLKIGSTLCATCTLHNTTTTESTKPHLQETTFTPTFMISTKKSDFTTSTTTTSKPVINYRLPKSVIPEHYDLELQPEIYGSNPAVFTFNGTVVITISVTMVTKNITLHKKHFTVDNVSLSTASDNDLRAPAIVGTRYDDVREFFTIDLGSDLDLGGRYKVAVSFHGNMRTDGDGLYVTSYTDNNETVYLSATHFEAPEARSAFPCFDEPAMKATFNVTLVRRLNTQRNYRTLSNTHRIDTEIRGDYAADRYATTPIMSTYLLAFIVCDFDYRENITSNVTVRTVARPNAIQYAGKAHEYGLNLFDWFVERFIPAYPLSKLENIALPYSAGAAMENWGLVTYKEVILDIPGLTTASDESWSVEAIGHEICHQWFGNVVSPKWWWWLWLKEGFASFWDFHALDDIYPARKETEQFVVQQMHSVFSTDSAQSSHPLTTNVESQEEVEDSFDGITYRKGGSIVRMMHFLMGEELFIKGLNLYLTRHQYGNADHYDLLNALSQKSFEEGTPINMTYLMDPWIVQNNYPVVMVTVLRTGVMNVRQQRFLANMSQDISSDNAPYGYKWSIPITYASSSNTSIFKKTYTFTDIEWLHQTEKNISDDVIPDPASADSWVLVNILQTGYYRVNYEERNWMAIIRHLELNHQIFPPINRAQIINDAWALQRSGLLSMGISLRTLNFLKTDTDYTAWRAFSRELGLLDRMLERSDLYGAFRAFMVDSIKQSYLLHRMNIDDEDLPFKIYHIMRSSNYACKYGLQECRDDAMRLYSDWMVNNTIIRPDIRGVVMCNAVRYGGQSEWNFAYRQYLESQHSSIATKAKDALTCTTEPWLLNRILRMTLNNSLIKKKDAKSVIIRVSRNPVGQDMAWSFVKSHFRVLHQQLKKSSLSSVVRTMATNYNTDYYISQLRDFNHSALVPGYVSTFRRSLATAQLNADWLKNNYDVIKAWLVERGFGSHLI